MKNVCLLFVALLVVALQIRPQTSQAAPTGSCVVQINDPVKGTVVDLRAPVSGKATIPPNGHLWILAHKKSLGVSWWPQNEVTVENGQFLLEVAFGIPADKGEFEAVAVVVSDATSKVLERWLDTAPANNYAPTRFPAVLEGCVPARVTVVRH